MCSFAQISMFQTPCEAQPEKIGWESFSVSLQDATDETLQAHEPGNGTPTGDSWDALVISQLAMEHGPCSSIKHVNSNCNWLVVNGCHVLFSHNIGLLIIPTDELIFFRGVETTHQVMFYLLTWRFSHGYSTLNYQRVCLNFWARI